MIELGYTVYPPFRRRGDAREAVVVSVAPSNAASQALSASLGFVRVGGQVDETDGYEDMLLLEGKALAACLPKVDTPPRGGRDDQDRSPSSHHARAGARRRR